jgi:hypothetical protein
MCWFFLGVLCCVWPVGAENPAARNPFGYADVPDPDGADIQQFAASVSLEGKLDGQSDDPNAEQWVSEYSDGNHRSLEGDWASRWNSAGQSPATGQLGTATFRVSKDRIFILYHEANSTYLLEGKVTNDGMFLARWALASANASGGGGRYVGRVVHAARIDGVWSENHARWDFRRKLR